MCRIQSIRVGSVIAIIALMLIGARPSFGAGGELTPTWKSGLSFTSDDGASKVAIGGQLMNDWGSFVSQNGASKSAVGDLQDGTEYRWARLSISGLMDERVEFRGQFDFATGSAAIRFAYVGLKRVPVVGNLRIGHQKEPFSLDGLTSVSYLPFMERSVAQAFVPFWNTGVLAFDTLLDQRVAWAAGVFRDTDNTGSGSGDGNYNLTGRISTSPLYSDGGSRVLHVGLAYSNRRPAGDVVRYRERPESHLAPWLVDTGSIPADGANLAGSEFLAIVGPVSVQSEYMMAFVDSPTGDDPQFSGYYVALGYFITGEHRPYKRSSGTPGRLSPTRPINGSGGIGAWEVLMRLSQIDLNDAGINGGTLRDITVGVNWHLNSNARLMANYVLSDGTSDQRCSIVQMRAQVDF